MKYLWLVCASCRKIDGTQGERISIYQALFLRSWLRMAVTFCMNEFPIRLHRKLQMDADRCNYLVNSDQDKNHLLDDQRTVAITSTDRALIGQYRPFFCRL